MPSWIADSTGRFPHVNNFTLAHDPVSKAWRLVLCETGANGGSSIRAVVAIPDAVMDGLTVAKSKLQEAEDEVTFAARKGAH